MRIGKNTKILTAILSLFLIAITRFYPSGHRWVPEPQPKHILLSDGSGRRLSSIFQGLSVDPGYSTFLKAIAEHQQRKCGAGQSSSLAFFRQQVSRVGQFLGMGPAAVVHAFGCDECGVYLTNYVYCAKVCGDYPYDGDLYPGDQDQGITLGSVICRTSNHSQCPGEIPTVSCSYCDQNGDDDDDDDDAVR